MELKTGQGERAAKPVRNVIAAVGRALVFLAGLFGVTGVAMMGCFWIAHQANDQIDSLSYFQSVALAGSFWTALLLFRVLRAGVPSLRPRHGAVIVPVPPSGDYTGWKKPLRVTLTATTNPYLADELPVEGLLMVHEMRTDNHAQRQHVSFQKLGRPPVLVNDAEWIYTLPRPASSE